MVDHRARLEKALRGCAERRTPDSIDLWPAIRDRASGTAAGREAGEIGARASEDRAGVGPRRRHPLVPNTPLGWALAAVSVLVLGFGVYVAAEPVRGFYRQGVPGAVGTGSEKPEAGAGPDDEPGDTRTQVDQVRTADGARVTLDWAYADERFVMIGLDTQDLGGAQKSDEFESGFGPVVLQPAIFDDTAGNEDRLPPYVRIEDGSGQDFDMIGGGTLGARRARAVFDAPEGLDPGRGHRFRLEVPLQEGGGISGEPGEEPDAGPFVFDFEIPVLPAPTIEVGQEVEAKGRTLRLERVIDSPGMPQAVICVKPGDDGQEWTPQLAYPGGRPENGFFSPQDLGDGCWSLTLGDPVEGPRSSVTVAGLEGMAEKESVSGRVETLRGPWTFEFETTAQ